MWIIHHDKSRAGGWDEMTLSVFSNGSVLINMSDEGGAMMQAVLVTVREVEAMIHLFEHAKTLLLKEEREWEFKFDSKD